MRVVFDTNIFVSALTLPGGAADAAVARITSGRDRLIISAAILDELLAVLARKFSRDTEELARVAVFFADQAQLVRPRLRLRILADEPDNRILECAVVGRADLIVTGDRAMLKLRRYATIAIVTLRHYLELPWA